MLTDIDVYTWLDSMLIPSVSRESAETDLAAGETEWAVFSLANEAFAADALTSAMLDKLIEEYPEGWMNEAFVYFKDNLHSSAA